MSSQATTIRLITMEKTADGAIEITFAMRVDPHRLVELNAAMIRLGVEQARENATRDAA